MPVKTAWIAGSTGLVGGHCLRLLLDRCENIVAIGRRPPSVHHPRLLARQQAFEDLSSMDAPTPDAVFCTLGSTLAKAGSRKAFHKVDCEYVVRLAAEGFHRGARQFLVVSSVDAEEWCPVYYLKVKAEMEAKVRALPYQAVHVFRPSFLYGHRTESRPAEGLGVLAAKALNPLMAGRFSKYRGIESADVAAAMVAAAQQASPGRHLYHWREMVAMAQELRRLG